MNFVYEHVESQRKESSERQRKVEARQRRRAAREKKARAATERRRVAEERVLPVLPYLTVDQVQHLALVFICGSINTGAHRRKLNVAQVGDCGTKK